MSWTNLSAAFAAALGRRGQPVAQQIALADHVDGRCLEAALDRQDGDGRSGRLRHLRPTLDTGQAIEAVIGRTWRSRSAVSSL